MLTKSHSAHGAGSLRPWTARPDPGWVFWQGSGGRARRQCLLYQIPLPPNVQLWLLPLLVMSLLVRKPQLGELTAGTAVPASAGEGGRGTGNAACLQSVCPECAGAGAPSAVEARAGQAPGAWLWAQDSKRAQNSPLLFSLCTPHSIFLLNHHLASARCPSGEECPHECSVSSSFLPPSAVCLLALGPVVPHAAKGPSPQPPAWTVSILQARPHTRDTPTCGLHLQAVLFIIIQFAEGEGE